MTNVEQPVQRADRSVRGNLYYLGGWDAVLETPGLGDKLYDLGKNINDLLNEIDAK